jgi:pyruvate kinase
MNKTSIITTIGPASSNRETLSFFRDNSVTVARLNFSHGSPESHLESANLCRKAGLEIMVDLAGPKILLGEIQQPSTIFRGNRIILELQESNKTYPYTLDNAEVFPCQFDIHNFVTSGISIYIDDGKIKLLVEKVEGDKVFCKIIAGGLVKSNKGVNIPEGQIEIDFLVERDRTYLEALINQIKPEIVALSFVKDSKQIIMVKEYLQSIISDNDYFPKICTKLELEKSVNKENFENVVDQSDMIMIARGDLALETEPVHILVPFYQKYITKYCKDVGVEVIIATQILESMITSPVPTRAEVSDLYRAVWIDEADYVMCSAETAIGSYAKECVELMSNMINEGQNYDDLISSKIENKISKNV